MIPLPAPKFNFNELLNTCISRLSDESLRSRFLAEFPNIEKTSQLAAEGFRLGSVPPPDPVSFKLEHVNNQQFKNLFDRHFQRSNSKGRVFRDQLMSAAPYGNCPYCAERKVTAIDHYLPKAVFPSLTLTPTNLVPSCSDCNRYKGAAIPSLTNPPVVHPYFDQLPLLDWLKAEIEWVDAPVILYRVNPQCSTSSQVTSRIKEHFRLFRLAELYGSHAAQALAEVQLQHEKLFLSGGAKQLREHLKETAQTLTSSLSHWKPALYKALSEDEKYCSNYFGTQTT